MKVKNYIVSVVALVLLDIFWIYFIMGRPYRQMIFLIQNEDMKINYMAGLLTYILMAAVPMLIYFKVYHTKCWSFI